jgi:tetratricopeptide (TPR) repeat protein
MVKKKKKGWKVLPWEDLAAFSRTRATSIPETALTAEQVRVAAVSSKKLLIQLSIVAMVVVLVYIPSLAGRFLFMDEFLMGAFQGQTKQPNFWNDVFSGIVLNPLSQAWLKTTFALDLASFARAPFWYHAINVSLHALTCVYFYILVFQLGRRWLPYEEKKTLAYDIALLSSLLLACHPLLNESVAYISGRAGVLTACNVFLGLNLLIFGLFAKRRGRAALCYLGCFLTLLMAVQSSPEGLAAPGIMFVLILLIRPETMSFYDWFDETAAQMSISAILAIALPFTARLPFSNPFDNNVAAAPLSLSIYLASQFKGFLCYYLRCAIVPIGLSILPTAFIAASWYDPGTIGGIIAFAALCYLAYWTKERKFICFALCMLIAGFVPSLLIQRFEYGADRRFYIPVAALCLLLGYWLAKKLSVKRKETLVDVAIILITLAGLSFWRETNWYDRRALLLSTIKTNPESNEARGLFALLELEGKDEKPKAEKDALQIVKGDPDCIPAVLVLGKVALVKHNWAEAKKHFTKALTLVTQRKAAPNFGWLARLGLAEALVNLKDYNEAHKELMWLVSLDPSSSQPNLLLGKTLVKLHQPILALHYLNRGYEIDPNNADYVEPLNQACAESGNPKLIKKAYHAAGIASKMFPTVNYSLIFAQAALETGHADECAAEIDKMSKDPKKYVLEPEDKARALYLYSLAAKEVGNEKLAARLKRQALIYDPNVADEIKITMVKDKESDGSEINPPLKAKSTEKNARKALSKPARFRQDKGQARPQ